MTDGTMLTHPAGVSAEQQQAARIAGLAYLVTFALVVTAEFVVRSPLMVSGDAAATMHTIAARARTFRFSVAMNLCYCAGVAVQVAALYVLLAPVSRFVALLAALWRSVYVITSVAMVLGMLSMARAAGAPDYHATAFAAPTHDLYQMARGVSWDGYYVGLAFTSLANTLVTWLLFRSRYVPRLLAAAGVAASAWCVLTTFAYLVDPGFRDVVNWWAYDTPMAVVDILIGFQLVIRGVRSA